MALIKCTECGTEVSSNADKCPKCANPIAQKKYKGPPEECFNCGGNLKKTKEAKSEGMGCLIIIIGLALTPVLIGIPILLYGFSIMGKREAFWVCKKCDSKFPRTIKWYELG